ERRTFLVLLTRYEELDSRAHMSNAAGCSNVLLLPFRGDYLTYASHREAGPHSEHRACGVAIHRLKTFRVYPVWNDRDSLRGRLNPLDQRFLYRLGYGDEHCRILKHPPIDRIFLQRQIVVAGDDEFCAFNSSTSECGDQVVTPHVRVND